MNRLGGDETMRPKERVLTTLACAEADRVPIDYCANPAIDARLKAHFGLGPDDSEGLLQALGVDFRGVGAPYIGAPLHEQIPDRQVDPLLGYRMLWVEHGAGGYWDYCDFPLRDADEETVAAWPMPSPDDYDYAAIADQCERQERYALYLGGAGLACIINTAGFLRGMEQVFLDLITEDPAGMLLIDRMLDVQFEVTRRSIEAARGAVDFVWMGEDLGTQKGPLISMDTFRRQIRPRHKPFFDLARAHDLPTMLHTCGSSSWTYEDYIEMGLTAADTLQPEATDMSPAYLKERFGGRLAFHGCISTAGAVSFGSPEDVEREVRNTLEIMMPGGGYCLAPTHALQDNSPTENVVALYEAAHRYGKYNKG